MHEQMNISKETDKRKENQKNINNFLKILVTEMKSIFYRLIRGFNRAKDKNQGT